jgi:hypothetical protein
MNEKIIVEYSSNNSGGGWWLKEEDWKALEERGWKLVGKFEYENGNYKYDEDGVPIFSKPNKETEWLGAYCKYAFRVGTDIKSVLEEFEEVTGQDVMDEGCGCCGAPHSFDWWYFKDGERVSLGWASGEDLGQYLYGETGGLSKREILKKLQ